MKHTCSWKNTHTNRLILSIIHFPLVCLYRQRLISERIWKVLPISMREDGIFLHVNKQLLKLRCESREDQRLEGTLDWDFLMPFQSRGTYIPFIFNLAAAEWTVITFMWITHVLTYSSVMQHVRKKTLISVELYKFTLFILYSSGTCDTMRN